MHKRATSPVDGVLASMKVPPKRKGNWRDSIFGFRPNRASMKVPPKRKGNHVVDGF